jgi:hypothetical protein
MTAHPLDGPAHTFLEGHELVVAEFVAQGAGIEDQLVPQVDAGWSHCWRQLVVRHSNDLPAPACGTAVLGRERKHVDRLGLTDVVCPVRSTLV